MYNADIPSRAELPSSEQLVRSTLIAAVTAAVLLVTTVLPAEYGIDPTGIGRVLGLTEMGEIKAQLADEAEADRQGAAPVEVLPAAPLPEKRSSLLGAVFAQLVGSAAASETSIVVAQAGRTDETTLRLRPGEGAEVKLEMTKGAKATYSWKAEGGVVNHDTHGEPHQSPNATHSYIKGRAVSGDEGVLEAAFDGNHGWFWRNRGSNDVTVRLKTSGSYASVKRVK